MGWKFGVDEEGSWELDDVLLIARVWVMKFPPPSAYRHTPISSQSGSSHFDPLKYIPPVFHNSTQPKKLRTTGHVDRKCLRQRAAYSLGVSRDKIVGQQLPYFEPCIIPQPDQYTWARICHPTVLHLSFPHFNRKVTIVKRSIINFL